MSIFVHFLRQKSLDSSSMPGGFIARAQNGLKAIDALERVANLDAIGLLAENKVFNIEDWPPDYWQAIAQRLSDSNGAARVAAARL